MNIKERLKWNISESCVTDDELITSQKFSTLLKRYSDQKWVCDWIRYFFWTYDAENREILSFKFYDFRKNIPASHKESQRSYEILFWKKQKFSAGMR